MTIILDKYVCVHARDSNNQNQIRVRVHLC